MSFFEDFSKKVSDAGKGVSQSAKNLADTTKLNGEISKIEKDIAQFYSTLGRTYYERHINDPEAENPEMINLISDAYRRISELRSEINNIKGIIPCPHCGSENPKGAVFCVKCGAKLPEQVKQEVPQPEEGTKKFCPSCGAEVDAGNRFCTKCGHDFSQDI